MQAVSLLLLPLVSTSDMASPGSDGDKGINFIVLLRRQSRLGELIFIWKIEYGLD